MRRSTTRIAGHRRDSSAPARKRWYHVLLSGWGAAGAALVTALAGLIVPKAWTFVADHARPPVTITVSDRELSDDHSYALPHPLSPADARQVSTPDQFFAPGNGIRARAIKLARSSVTVTVQGDNSRAVVITDLRATILRERPAPAGTLFFAPSQGTMTTIRLGVDLDEPVPVARSLVDETLTDPYFRDNAVSIGNGESVVFQVDARAARASYDWVIELDLVVDGALRREVVRPAHGSFQLSGFSQRYAEIYEWQGERWDRPDPRERVAAYEGAP